MISDELLRGALVLSLEETIAFHKRASEENPHRFSLAYKIRKRSIIRLAERYETEKPHTERHFMPLRRLALFMAIITAAVVLSVGAYAAYLIINGFAFDVHEEYSDVTLNISEYELKDTITELYLLPPESGCKCIHETHDDEIVMSHYQWNENTITLVQYTKYAADLIRVNTENANVYGVNVNGNDGFMVIHYSESLDILKELMWVNDGYIFYISCKIITDEELIKLAESIVIEENTE